MIAGVIVLVAALYFLGTLGRRRPSARLAPTPTPTATPRRRQRRREEEEEKQQQAPAKPKVVRLQIQPTGPVSVCLENAAGEPLIENVTLRPTRTPRRSAPSASAMSFGTPEAVMRVDGKPYQVSENAPIGYEVQAGGKPKALPEAERPTCSG